ncbi:PhnD/SsuA/transferrin family substrate-binding protein [Lentzea aerocolonigenes]|uniref:PhnD/SsuA/transferrin family substrate-binding protein n=1 Tax=Lentzea aerocolonigenes TaxID=68170 RepID=UPI0018C8B4CF
MRFGVEPYAAPDKLKPAYEVLAKALTRKLGCEVELQIVDDYAAEVLAMRFHVTAPGGGRRARPGRGRARWSCRCRR